MQEDPIYTVKARVGVRHVGGLGQGKRWKARDERAREK